MTVCWSGALVSLFLWVISTSCGCVRGTPQFIVTSGKPRCYSIEVPKETTVKIHYEAPDIDTNTDATAYAPTYITLSEKGIETLEEQRMAEHDNANANANAHEHANADTPASHARKTGTKPVSQELTARSGSFLHTIRDRDAVVDACIRASGATPRAPMLFHVRVEELEEDVPPETEARVGVNAEHHWSFLETQLDRIEHEMHTVLREADFFRERDALYHQQTDDLHKATLFWPMLHCCILVLTGVTQANHIVSFFKQRRIV